MTILKRLRGVVAFMTINNIQSLHIKAPWKIIEELTHEFESSKQIKYERGPLCFSASAYEWVQIAMPLGAAGISALVAILVAKIQQNKRVKVTFNENGKITSIEAPTKEQVIEICNEINNIQDIIID